MSTSTPTLNPAVPFLITALTDLLVGALVRNSNPTVEAARAQTVISVANGITTIASGNVTAGLQAIDTALASSSTDPANAAAIQVALSWIATKAAALQQLLAGSVASALATQIVSQVAAAAIAVAQKYIPAASTTATTAAAA